MTAASQPPLRAARHAKGKRPSFSDSGGADQLLSMVLVLASEICVLQDRIDSIERVSAVKGIDLHAEIEALQLDQTALVARETRRQDLLNRLYYLMRKEAADLTGSDSAERYAAVIDEIAQP